MGLGVPNRMWRRRSWIHSAPWTNQSHHNPPDYSGRLGFAPWTVCLRVTQQIGIVMEHWILLHAVISIAEWQWVCSLPIVAGYARYRSVGGQSVTVRLLFETTTRRLGP